MIEFEDADEFIKRFEYIYSKKILRIPYTTKEGVRKTLLMCKCGKSFISLPYLSLGVFENKITDKNSAPFMLFETDEKNIISTSKKRWEIRDTLAHSSYIYADKISFLQKLTTHEDILQLYSSDIRRKIRKSLKEGFIIKYGTEEKLIKDFYFAYQKRMNEIGIASVGKKIIQKGVKAKVTTVFVAYKGENIAGGATLNTFNGEVYTNELFAPLSQFHKYYISYALHYEMMRFAKDNNAVYYSFGRSTRNSSVHNYKRHFKAEEISLYWSYSYKKKNIRDNKFLYWIWSKLPYCLTKYLGQAVSKYIY